MKKSRNHNYPVNAKVTYGTCLVGDHPFDAHRFDKKYCSDACKQQDYLARKKSGLTELVFKGTKENLFAFRRKGNILFLSAFSVELFGKVEPDETEKIIMTKGLDMSWIAETKDFRLHHIAYNKKNPFELFYKKGKY